MKNKHFTKREATQDELHSALDWALKNDANNPVAILFLGLLDVVGSVEETTNDDSEGGIYDSITCGNRFNDFFHEIAEEFIQVYNDIFTLRDNLAILICRLQKYKYRLP